MYRNAIFIFSGLLASAFCTSTAWADGAVYAMTNALGNNQVLVFHRAANGSLSATPIQTIATGGGGSGLQLGGIDSLGSSGSIQLDTVNRLLFVVNTESAAENNGAGAYNQDCRQGTITSFRVASDGTLTFADRVLSGGLFPNSLTLRKRGASSVETGGLIYVLNAGGPGTCGLSPNVTGFRVNSAGRMQAVNSQQPIDPGPASGSGVNCPPIGFAPAADFQCGLNPPSFPRSPAEVRFTPDGNQLAVTVKGTNSIYVFPVDANQRLGSPVINQAPGPALPSYFAFTFDRNSHMLVTELFGTATAIPAGGAGAVTSLTVNRSGLLDTISAHVSDGGTAACWIALDPVSGNYAYVANNLSNSISTYTVHSDGTVSLLAAIGAAASGPNDMAVVNESGSGYLYVVNAATGTVGAFAIQSSGALSPLAGGSGLPVNAGAQGLAAY
jgi:6-phosphogluconolactonase (cycloisomerase 2 family)